MSTEPLARQGAKTMDQERLALLDSISLKSGSHRSFEDGVDVMEAAAYLAGEPHSDHPVCVSDVIGSFMRAWGDDLATDEDRNRLLKPLVLTIIGTRTSFEDDQVRSWMAFDWLVFEHLPAWLDLAGGGLEAYAAALRALPEIANSEALSKARPVIDAASVDVAVAASVDAAAAAAAAAAADFAVVLDVVDAVVAAVVDAARVAVVAALAAQEAPREQLAPTVARLQESAVALVERMAVVGRVPVTEAS